MRISPDVRVVDLSDETKPPFMVCADQKLIFAIITNGPACGAQPGVECRFRHIAPTPYNFDEFVFADDTIVVANEVDEQIEYLRLDLNERSRPPQFMPRDIDLKIREMKLQDSPHL